MITFKDEDIVDYAEDIVVYQASIKGELNRGLGKRLAKKFPRLEPNYSKFCFDYKYSYAELKKDVYAFFDKNKIIVSMFSQKPNYETDIPVLRSALYKIKKWAYNNNKTVALPYYLGSHNDEEWQKIYEIIKEVFLIKEKNEENLVNVSIYKKVGLPIEKDIEILLDVIHDKDSLSERDFEAISNVLGELDEERLELAALTKENNTQKIKLEQSIRLEVLSKRAEKLQQQIQDLVQSKRPEQEKQTEMIKLTSKLELIQELLRRKNDDQSREIDRYTNTKS